SIDLEREAFIEQVNRHGIAVISQSGNMTPADKMMYSLRDVTATIESVPLIASSIMSKKIAAGADAIVLDVKTGSGAFMKSAEDSIALAQAMVSIGTKLNLQTTALITSMEQPLGYAVGNALEVKEAIAALKGDGPKDLTELCLSLGAYMLIMGQKADDYEEAREKLQQILDKGYALKKFKEWIAAQGGSPSIVDQPELLPNSAHMITVLAAEEGYVQHIHSEQIGHTAMMIGAGRETKAAKIDLTAGVMLRKKIGDHVRPGEILAELHTGMDLRRLSQAAELAFSSFVIGKERKAPEPLLYAIVTEQGVKRLQ
ncbi:MAG: pyrimidine-nucleoside phosphorylase, partial [Paenibacillus sp. RIFOXYA1_FULL_44_5]